MFSPKMQRRRKARFEIELACSVQPKNGLQVAEGTTINISRSGALIKIISATWGPESVPHPGNALSVEIRLPSTLYFSPRCFSCKGVTVRTDKLSEGYLMAVRFERMEVGVVRRGGNVLTTWLPR
jgi:c-di-GMP-binding flagellar brake protein YcgR